MTTSRRTGALRLAALGVSAAAALAATAVPASATQYGDYDVRGSIEVRYLEVGGPNSPLGLPLTDETPTLDTYGRFNRFQGGSIAWHPVTGAWEVHGAIHQRWAEMGYERTVLGYPISNEDRTPDGVGRVNHFQGGKIYWTPTTGAHEIYGAILQEWIRLGYEKSALGYPISGEYGVPGGRRSDFQGGSITFTNTGATVVALNQAPGNVITGAGSQTVPISKPRGPMLVRSRTTGAPGGDFFAAGLVGGDYNDLLAYGVAPYDGVAPLDFRWDAPTSPQTTKIEVESNTTWSFELIPLSAAGTFGKGQTIGESRGTVWHDTGRAGTARLTHTAGTGDFEVYSYDADTSDLKELVFGEGYEDVYVPIEADQWVEIISDGSWAITVV